VNVAVVELAGKGGLIHYAYQLCRAMHGLGADVTLITDRHYELGALPHPFRLEPVLDLWDPKPAVPQRAGLLRRASRAAIYHREWLRAAAILRRMKPDVAQFGDIRFATDLFPLAAARGAARLSADVCHNVHPFSATGGFALSPLQRALYRRVYSGFDAIFVHYDANVAEFARTFPDSASRVTRIVHGNEEIFRELASAIITPRSLRLELGLRDNDRVVLFFGTLARYKGLDTLIEAFARVEDAVLVIAGFPLDSIPETGSRMRVVPRYIEAEAVSAWMGLADVIVFPYRTVFQSGALHVAQTFGVPIVATRVGATPEVLRDRESGLLVEPEDPAALAQAINQLLADRSLAQRLGETAAHDATTRFSWSGIAATMLGTYESLLARRQR
jgi:glycosyltransferase involved in cell wall biosynthesis